MHLGLCGLASSGKSTVFAALTSRRSDSAGGANLAQLAVPDRRLQELSRLHKPKKTTFAQISFVDPPRPKAKPGDPTTRLPIELRQVDGLLEVVRNFDAGLGPPSPREDHHAMAQEMLLSDLITVERRLERMAGERQRGRSVDPEEIELCTRAQEQLGAERPLRQEPELAGHPKLRGFGLLSARPLLVVANNDDEDADPPDLGSKEPPLVIRARLEAELAELPPDERAEFAAGYGITASALDRLIAASYRALGLISFFTVIGDEVRAWSVPRGTPALKAAGTIHSDMERGFIRAEVMRQEDLMELGSEAAVRKAGLQKVVGKEYLVQDGEVLQVRFNV